MAEDSQRAQIWTRIYRWVAGYFRAAMDSAGGRRKRIIFGLKGILALGFLGFVALGVYAFTLLPFTPSISELKKAKIDRPTMLVSADNKILATLKPMNRQWVPLNHISPNVINALIATEDHRFYQHFGIDLLRVGSGIVRTITGDPQGASTLTQQLARNLFPEEVGRKRTITRKLKETITAFKIEYAYTKNEILETYLNTMPFLYNAYGIEMAARTYFDKPAQKLNVLESATLIAMLKGTTYYNPVLNPERALKRRNVVLKQMVKRGVLSKAEYDRLKTRPIHLDFARQPEPIGPAPHLTSQIRKWLIDWADRTDHNIYSDGLIVHTTIDSRLQALANRAVTREMDLLQTVADVEWAVSSEGVMSGDPRAYTDVHRRIKPFDYFWKSKPGLVDTFIRESPAYQAAIDGGATPQAALAQLKNNRDFLAKLRAEKTRLQAGFVAIDPATGEIKAWVGSRDFKTDEFDHVAQARRQPGSTFKPFVYGAALEAGMSPDKRFTDGPVEIKLPDGNVWRPSDLQPPSGRRMTAREGLIYSKNTITAQVMQEVGPRKAAALARRMGVNKSELDEVPSLALGTSPVTPLEMVAAYSTLAARGNYRQPTFVTHITDKDGKIVAEFRNAGKSVISDRTVGNLINMLRDAVDQGTGQAVRTRFGLRADMAGKTGTTQKNTDGWFILMHPRLVAGAWVGFNDSRVTMRSSYWGEGGHNALLLVGDFFQQALSAQLIDQYARFPYARPTNSFWDPYVEQAKEWFFDAIKGWWSGDRTKAAPPPVRHEANAQPAPDSSNDDAEQRRLAREMQKERLLERLREKRAEREQEETERERFPAD